jgi:hypothetical protein
VPDQWRQERRIIDLHQHVDVTEEHMSRWLRIMDRVGVGVGVNLSGGTVTAKPGELSAFERTQALTERLLQGGQCYTSISTTPDGTNPISPSEPSSK